MTRSVLIEFVGPHGDEQDLLDFEPAGIYRELRRLKTRRRLRAVTSPRVEVFLLKLWCDTGWRTRSDLLRLMRRYPHSALYVATTFGTAVLNVALHQADASLLPDGERWDSSELVEPLRAMEYAKPGHA
jgi:hypothetical protein